MKIGPAERNGMEMLLLVFSHWEIAGIIWRWEKSKRKGKIRGVASFTSFAEQLGCISRFGAFS